MKTDGKLISFKKGGYIVPVAIAVLVVASIGLLTASWWNGSKKEVATPKNIPNQNQTATNPVANHPAVVVSTANDDQTLDSDGTAIDNSLKGLDGANVDITSSLNDTPASLQ